MYRSFYGLTKKPFQISSDPSFMWMGEKHEEALATLKYGILDNKGFLLLTGDVGTGKTTLINALIQSLSEDIICTSVPDPGLEKLDFFNYIGAAFGIEREFATKGAFLANFRQFLIQSNETGKKVLLIIDEAQLLTQELLEEIRLLSNIEKTDTKLINIFFIGQNEFNEILNRQQNRAVRQRLTLNYNIDPLTPDEISEYINHRLKVAGTDESIFDDQAKHEIFMYSGGFPRRINVICDHCLLSGYVKEQKTISADIVKECARELKIPERIRNRDINGFTRPEPVVPTAPPQERHQPISQMPTPTPTPVNPIVEKRGTGLFLGAFVGIAFILFAWFFMFPNHFSDSMLLFREKIFQTLSDFDKNKMNRSNVIDEKIQDKSQSPDLNKPSGHEKNTPVNDPSVQNGTQLKNTIKKKINIHTEILPIPPKEDIVVNLVETSIDNPEPIVPADLEPIPTKPKANLPDKKKLSDQLEPITIVPQEKEPLPLPEEKIIVRFKYNTNDFTKNGYEKLVDFSNILIEYPESSISIVGYTDKQGTKTYNKKLSEFRANIIRSFFLGRGIAPDQIKVEGRGSEDPIENNDSAWGRMMNRRVEIQVIQ